MEVKLLSCTNHASKIVATAAKIAVTPGKAIEIFDSIKEDKKADEVVERVLGYGHMSISEHVSFNFGIQDVSLVVETFLISHRLASYTIRSGRYTSFDDDNLFVPEFRFNSYVDDDTKVKAKELYKDFAKHAFSEYNYFLEKGIKPEDARFCLPYGVKTNIYFTVNARELIHVISAALHGRGKRNAEIVKLGERLLKLGKEVLPTVFKDVERYELGQEEKVDRLNEIFTRHEMQDVERQTRAIVELIDYEEDAERKVGVLALINQFNCDTAYAQMRANDTDILKEILEIVCNDKRKRELEQISYTFRMNNLTLPILKHIMRHRMQSILIPSFVQVGKSKTYSTPPSMEENDQSEEIIERYKKVHEMGRELYEKLEAMDVRKEDLAYTYLMGDEVCDVVTTMNARELYHFLSLRTCTRAQWAIRDIALSMLKKLKEVAPYIFSLAGPNCYSKGKCTEGKMSCKQMDEVAKQIKEL